MSNPTLTPGTERRLKQMVEAEMSRKLAAPLKEVKEFAKAAGKIDAQVAKIAAERKAVSKLAAVANKRILRLEKNGLQNTHAYRKYLQDGGRKFGVKGKSNEEVQEEVGRLIRFLDAADSTVKGARASIKKQADAFGITYKTVKEMQSKYEQFMKIFAPLKKIYEDQYGAAMVLDYNRVTTAAKTYLDTSKWELEMTEEAVAEAIAHLKKVAGFYEERIPTPNGGVLLKNSGN